MQHVLVHHAVATGRVTQGTNMAADNTPNQLRAQVGTHTLGAADPVITAGPFHGFVPLIHQDGDPVFVVRFYLRSIQIMGIPGIVR